MEEREIGMRRSGRRAGRSRSGRKSRMSRDVGKGRTMSGRMRRRDNRRKKVGRRRIERYVKDLLILHIGEEVWIVVTRYAPCLGTQ